MMDKDVAYLLEADACVFYEKVPWTSSHCDEETVWRDSKALTFECVSKVPKSIFSENLVVSRDVNICYL